MTELAIWEKRLIREWRALQQSPGKEFQGSRGSHKASRVSPAPAADRLKKLPGTDKFDNAQATDRRKNTPAADRLSPAELDRAADRLSPAELDRAADRLSPAELDRAAADLLALQRGLTGERRLIASAYMDEGRRLGAYLLFYWFTSYTQTRGMLDMALRALGAQNSDHKPEGITAPGTARSGLFYEDANTTFRILDLGSGPAPCSIAAADWFSGMNKTIAKNIEITACDQSILSLSAAERLADGAGYRLNRVAPWQAGTDPIPEGPFHCIVIGHLLNELWKDASDRVEQRAALIDALGTQLAAGGIILILEPALLSTGRDLLALRDRLLGHRWRVLAPCFTQKACPALAQPNQTCHSDFTWQVPRTVQELERRTGLDKDLVKTTALVLSRPGTAESGTQDRVHDSGRPAEIAEAAGPDTTLGTGGTSGPAKVTGPAQSAEATQSTDTAQTAGPAKVTGSENSVGVINQRGPYRVVSEPMLNKAGRTRLILCGDEGRIPFSAKLGEDLPAEKVFKTLRRSDAITLSGAEQRESGLALGEFTQIFLI